MAYGMFDLRLQDLVMEFLNERKNELSEVTIRNYHCIFKHYKRIKFEDFKRRDAMLYFRNSASAKWKLSTVDTYLNHLATFGNWLCEKHLVNQRFRSKKIAKQKFKATPTESELESLFDSLYQNYLTASAIKKQTYANRYLVTRVISETGARISEATSIFVDDLLRNEDRHYLIIRGTKSEMSERTVAIPKKLYNELKNYITLFEAEGRLFSQKNGNKVDTLEYGKHLKKHAEDLGIEARIHPHLFRFLWIIEQIRKGTDAFEIMVRLGHSDISMTLGYLNQVRRIYPDTLINNSWKIMEEKAKKSSHYFNKKQHKGDRDYNE